MASLQIRWARWLGKYLVATYVDIWDFRPWWFDTR